MSSAMKPCSTQKSYKDFEPQEYRRKLNRGEQGMASNYRYKQMVLYTNDFSEENFICTFQYGKIYHAKYPKMPFGFEDKFVKKWDIPDICEEDYQCVNLVMNEVILLQHEKVIQHPGMIEFLGFCWDGENLCAVYDFNPLDSVYNLVPKDAFTWLQRIKVAFGFARLLKFFHARTSKLLVRNIGAAHIMVDEKYNPKLCDFSMMVGGIFPNETLYECKGCYGYIDPNIVSSDTLWSEKTDVFAFGVVLLNLITKRVDTEENKQSNAPLLYVWVLDQFESCESTLSLVDQSLAKDSSFSYKDGCEITNLALKCVNKVVEERPSMKQVVKNLLKLEVVNENAEFLGLVPKDDILTPIDVVVSKPT